MSLFSQRKGIRPLQKAIQRESIDDELRNSIWNCLSVIIWDKWDFHDVYRNNKQVEMFVRLIWLNYFKLPLDTIPSFNKKYNPSAYQELRKYFYEAKWWQIYDFTEFAIKNVNKNWSDDLGLFLNRVLESENAAYRLIGNQIVEITDELEIQTIESALENGVKSAKAHISRALELLSDRKSPDYRNSVKEAILAVEAICRLISGKEKATLGECLNAFKLKKPIHPAFEAAFQKLYGFTSDESGIRHAMTEKQEVTTYADAKFMLVACSAFVNYLLTKASEDDIKI